MVRFILFSVLCLYFGLFYPSSLKGETPPQILEIAIDDNFPPYTMRYSDGSFGGLFVEILGNALNQADISFKFVGVPWKRLVYRTNKAQVDASMPWREKKERFEKYHMVGPLTLKGSQTIFLTLHTFPVKKWDQLTNLAQYKIGLIAGYAYPKSFEEADYLNKVTVTADNDVLLKLLDRGRVDLIIGDQHVLAAEAARLGLGHRFTQLGRPLDAIKRYVAVPKNKQETANALQKALETFHTNELYAEILKRYR